MEAVAAVGENGIVNVERLTSDDLVRWACSMTIHGKDTKIGLEKLYKAEHSPIRCDMYKVELRRVPTFVSVHFVRHKIGVEHFVAGNREDRGGDGEATRMTPILHGMLINAQALIGMARKRLCMKTHATTRDWMWGIYLGVNTINPLLAKYLVPECEYRGGFCPEMQSCGMYPPLER